jgi:hypothetical protein
MRATPPAGIPRAEARAGSESLPRLNFAKIVLIMTAISCYAAPPEMGIGLENMPPLKADRFDSVCQTIYDFPPIDCHRLFGQKL